MEDASFLHGEMAPSRLILMGFFLSDSVDEAVLGHYL